MTTSKPGSVGGPGTKAGTVALASAGGVGEAARRFFDRALADHARPVEMITDKAPALLAAVDDVLPDALPNTDRYSTIASRPTTAD